MYWNLKTLLEIWNLIGPQEIFVQDVKDRPHWFPVIKLGTRLLIEETGHPI